MHSGYKNPKERFNVHEQLGFPESQSTLRSTPTPHLSISLDFIEGYYEIVKTEEIHIVLYHETANESLVLTTVDEGLAIGRSL